MSRAEAAAIVYIALPTIVFVGGWIASEPWPTSARFTVEVAAGAISYGVVLLSFFRPRILRYVNFLSGLRRGKGEPVPATL